MIGFTEFLNELFNKPVSYIEKNNDFVFNIDDVEYTVVIDIDDEDESIIQVSFYIKDKTQGFDKTSISFSGGNEIKVFSTVLQIIKDYLKNDKSITGIAFTSDIKEPSRVKLYDRMVKSVAKPLGYNLEASYNTSYSKIYILRK